jgi:ATP-dependent HslUV protease ATP-binding subunit HslU
MARFTEAVSSQLKRMDGLGSSSGSSSAGMNGSRHRTERRKIAIGEARNLLTEAELDATISQDDVLKAAIHSLEQDGIVFLDEIDKIASSSTGISGSGGRGADASADGVQRDLLPLIEGTTVTTKHGDIKTDHILFIASGSFHAVKPSDLLAELQGRLPVRVELQGLTEDDLYRILTATRHNLLEQQIQLLGVDNIHLSFTDAAIREIARVAAEVNRTIENIGARRLSTVVERIVSDLSFQAPDMPSNTHIVIDAEQVRDKVADLMKSADLQKYIL